ncbi:hypothetical protein ACEYYB_14240 [Paracoccus sp. p4-l81]|uniref:hypothetical protein n=1 Tax=Paracoccus sp. p4-l81 TaxID=3342806 RepID=UPI0035B9F62B
MRVKTLRDILGACARILPEDDKRFCGPFLIDARRRGAPDRPMSLFVGQETNGWTPLQQMIADPDPAGLTQRWHDDFDQGSGNSGGRARRSPFWRLHRMLADRLSVPRQNLVWSNLLRFDARPLADTVGRKKNASLMTNGIAELSALMDAQHGMLHDDIVALRVRGVIFVTGPSYDWAIRREFPGVTIAPLSARFPARTLARVQLPGLPDVRAVRSYHPAYLSRHKMIADVVDAVADQRHD